MFRWSGLPSRPISRSQIGLIFLGPRGPERLYLFTTAATVDGPKRDRRSAHPFGAIEFGDECQPLTKTQRALKRAVDFSLALALIVALSPLLIAVAAAIGAGSPGPII